MKFLHIFRKLTAGLLVFSMLPLSACATLGKTPENSETTPPKETANSKPPVSTDVYTPESDPALEISELMALNTAGITDENGNHCGWIELHNRTAASVKLSEYTLEFGIRSYNLPDLILEGDGYVIIYANGKGEGVNASFTLGSTGKLILRHGKMLTHELSYVNRTVNHSFVPLTGGETAQPTPGYKEVKAPDGLIISEIMSNNDTTPIHGELKDYLELYNSGEEPIDLSNYYISQDPAKPYDHSMEKKIIEAGEYYLLVQDENLPFGLSKDGESVYITRADGVLIASATFGAMADGQVYLHEKGIATQASPGYPNTREGMFAAICSRKGLVINEVISSNGSYSVLNEEYYDLVEIWNNSDEPVHLGDYYFSDSKKEPQRYRLPRITLGAGEYYVFHCTGTAKLPATARISLSSDGETVYLSKADGTFSDVLTLPAMPYNVSYGRGEDALYYFAAPTLGKTNSKGCLTVADAPSVTLAPGQYSGTQQVKLWGEGTIYYTLDGTRPTTDSSLYRGEVIEITETTAIRTFAVKEGAIDSAAVTYNYLIDLPDYDLPVLKISVNNEDMFGTSGIYTNYNSHQEKECSVALFVEGKEEFAVNCGIKIFGALSRTYDKKSFQLKFKAKYGTSKLKYKLFDNLEIDEFDSLVVRSGSQGAMRYRAFFNDELVTSLASEGGEMTDLLVQAYRPCNLYINGEYYGIYYIREKIDEDFIAAHTGYSPESITVIEWVNLLKYGSTDQGWNELYRYAISHDLSKDGEYQVVADQICPESFADLFIMRIWAADRDSDNIRAWRSTEGDGKWRFILYDCDISFENDFASVGYMFTTQKQAETQKLVRAMMQNRQFRELLIRRFDLHCKNTLSPERTNAKVNQLEAQLLQDMPYGIERWKNAAESCHPSVSHWQGRVEDLRSRFLSEDYLESIKIDFVTVLKLSPDEVRATLGAEYLQYCP